jgi:phosphoribosylformylglycinamidine cyclo-ligase
MMDKYDTVGIDCVAMNVNDLLCVGATPISLVDCIALEDANPALLEEISKGLCAGADQAGVSIVGGEIAQLPEMVRGVRAGYAFDLTATAVGTVALDRIHRGGRGSRRRRAHSHREQRHPQQWTVARAGCLVQAKSLRRTGFTA